MPKSKEITELERKKFLNNLNEQQKIKLERLAEINKEIANDELRKIHLFGKEMIEIKGDKNAFGNKFMDNIAPLFGYKPSALYKRMEFAQIFSSEDVERILAMPFSGGRGSLSWGHCAILLSKCHEQSLRWELLEEAAKNGWTTDVLKAKARERVPNSQRRNNPGRPATTPESVDGKLLQINDTLTPLAKRAELWVSDDNGLVSALNKVPSEKLDRTWETKLHELTEKTISVMLVLKKTADHLSAARIWLEKQFEESEEVSSTKNEDADLKEINSLLG
jgi:DUF1016 N-terminal domain